jgi:hypothetical protein
VVSSTDEKCTPRTAPRAGQVIQKCKRLLEVSPSGFVINYFRKLAALRWDASRSGIENKS